MPSNHPGTRSHGPMELSPTGPLLEAKRNQVENGWSSLLWIMALNITHHPREWFTFCMLEMKIHIYCIYIYNVLFDFCICTTILNQQLSVWTSCEAKNSLAERPSHKLVVHYSWHLVMNHCFRSILQWIEVGSKTDLWIINYRKTIQVLSPKFFETICPAICMTIPRVRKSWGNHPPKMAWISVEISQQKMAPSPPAAEQRSLEELPGPRGANGRKFPPIWWPCWRGLHWGRHLLLIDYSDVNMVLKRRSTPNECQTLFNWFCTRKSHVSVLPLLLRVDVTHDLASCLLLHWEIQELITLCSSW